MTVSLRPIRQGLPRVPGGEPWPPPGFVEVEDGPDFLGETAVDIDVAQSVTQPSTAPVVPASEAAAEPAATAALVAPAAPSPQLEQRRVSLRQGLPRTPGGEPWPPAGFGVLTVSNVEFDLSAVASQPQTTGAVAAPMVESDDSPATATTAVGAPPAAVGAAAAAPAGAATVVGPSISVSATEERRLPLRQGLPRTKGGEPWPPAGFGALTVSVDDFDLSAPPADVTATSAAPLQSGTTEQVASVSTGAGATATGPTVTVSTSVERVPLRRGLPRTKGGEPWPPAGFGALTVPLVQEAPTAPTIIGDLSASVTTEAPAAKDPRLEAPVASASVAAAAASVPADQPSPVARPTQSAPATRPTPTPRPAAKPSARPTTKPAARATAKPGAGSSTERQPFDLAAFLTKVVEVVRFPAVALVGAIAVVAGLFMLVRWLLGTEVMVEFLAKYPGEYHLPEGAPSGFPGWLRWTHFLNMFFIIMIIRSGLQNRYEKKPPAYWTPRWSGFGGGKKISISLWFHQMLDILWLLNGITFVTLLFVTSQWMRIVPTSWTVFPNALSAMLQYISLDWPTENGWVNYNSLQQLMYFLVVFIAAPLAAVTGLRMSGLWPSKAKRLSAAYPLELARAVHFPTMIFFVFFIITHVAMVFATGALKNLNHMFAGTDSTNWAGFWIFVVALAAIAVVWELARPMILAPIANLLGNVSQR